MRFSWNWLSTRMALGCLAGVFWVGSSPHGVAAGAVEPGLEQAVEWKWWVVPSELGGWGIPIEEEKKSDGSHAGASGDRPAEYAVAKGDALAKIARKFDMTVWQLKKFNDMENDRIVIGQKLKIPNVVELLKLVPPPPPPPPEPVGRKRRKPAHAVPEPPMPEESALPEDQLENVRLQVFLDRQMYSPGMIDGKDGPLFQKVCEIYQKNNPDAADPIRFKAKALSAVADPFVRYTLRIEDFSFIRTAKPAQAPQPAAGKGGGKGKSGKGGAIAKETSTPPAIDRLLGEKFLSYQNGWEFVAERFHCDEAFLRALNPLVKGDPVAGMELKVPAVEPFEIEKALDGEMQPAADPANPVLAAVVLVQRLEIWKSGRLVAVMPVAAARPGLCGRGSWTVMDAVTRPMLATKREPRETPKPPEAPGGSPPGAGDSLVALPIPPPLEQEQHLAAGPNNPVGVCWIHLSKQGGKEPLPYGLHGTSIPGRMRTQHGIGGFRMTNWDIARAVRLIPKGTALQWRAR